MVSVAVYAEGRTEWFVARQLCKRTILNGMDFIKHDQYPGNMVIGGGVDAFLKKLVEPSGKKGIFISPHANKILLMFDQEQISDLGKDVKSRVEIYLKKYDINSNFHQHDKYSNVFIGTVDTDDVSLSVVVHVANKESPDGNKDFDGYIVELLQCLKGVPIVKNILDGNITALKKPDMAQVVCQIGGQDIPLLMEEKQWSIKRSKTILYSYITAMQIGKSHTIFSEKVVEKSDEEDLRNVFASLIAAWDSLKEDT